MNVPLLTDILVIFALAIAVLLICYRLRVATLVGFLITGVLAGPHGLGLISAVKDVEVLAEIGVILLLFTIGLEFSLESLLRIKRLVLLGGTLQVLVTIAGVYGLSRLAGLPPHQSVFVGFLIALSSTAIVLKLLQERSEVESPHGQAALGILIFQDIAVVPMMLLTPVLSGSSGAFMDAIPLLILKGTGFLALVLAGAKWFVPHLLFQIAKTRSKELFLLSILVICFSVAFLSHWLGLSLALGAFMAGLIISETEFSHETLGTILPFRDAFTSLFFVSIGMFLDMKILFQHPLLILGTALLVLVLKSLLAGLVVLLLGFPLRTGILTGLSICQVGEFSFILFMKGSGLGLLDSWTNQIFLDISVMTMALTPFVITFGPRLADLLLKMPAPEVIRRGFSRGLQVGAKGGPVKLRDHLIIVGFGLNGRNLARASAKSGIPYAVIEMNPQTVRKEREKGEPIFYGDASQGEVLAHANLAEARILVIVISDPFAVRRMTATARRMNPSLYILVRTRYLSEMKALYELGASEVIPEEFETSIEIFSRVLAKYLVARDDIERLVSQARGDGYEMFRSLSQGGASFSDLKLNLPDLDISTIRVEDGSPAAGKSIGEMEMRKKHGITVLAVVREGKTLANPDAGTVLRPMDLLIVLGQVRRLSEACNLFVCGSEGG
ncbi:MAG: cation:proton antiporter [Thermodesulfobacteriota bacterium]